MTDIVPGDRVKIEIEGTVLDGGNEFVRVATEDDRNLVYYVRTSFVTRLAPQAQAGEAWMYRWDGEDTVGFVSKAAWGDELNITVVDAEQDSVSRTFPLQPDRLIRKMS